MSTFLKRSGFFRLVLWAAALFSAAMVMTVFAVPASAAIVYGIGYADNSSTSYRRPISNSFASSDTAGNYSSHFLGENPLIDHYGVLDLLSPTTLTGISYQFIGPTPSRSVNTFNLQMSNDSTFGTYEAIGSQSSIAYGTTYNVSFTQTQAYRYLKVVMPAAGNPGDGTWTELGKFTLNSASGTVLNPVRTTGGTGPSIPLLASYMSTSSSYPGYEPDKLVDGITYGDPGTHVMLDGSATEPFYKHQISLPVSQPISSIGIYNGGRNGYTLDGAKAVYVQTSLDGVAWTSYGFYALQQGVGNINNPQQLIDLPSDTLAKYVRLIPVDTYGGQMGFLEMSELTLFAPEPSSLALLAVGMLSLLRRRRIAA